MSAPLLGQPYASCSRPALPAACWSSLYTEATVTLGNSYYSAPRYLGSSGLSLPLGGGLAGASYFSPLHSPRTQSLALPGTASASPFSSQAITNYIPAGSLAGTFSSSTAALPGRHAAVPLAAISTQAQASQGGMTTPVDVGFEGEGQWLEFFPEHGGLGVRAKQPLPKGRFLAALRDYSPVDGLPGRDFFVKVNDGAFRQGMSRAEYEAQAGRCNCVGRGLNEGTFLVSTRDIAAGEPLSLFYGAQFWYEGRPFSNPPGGGPSH